MKVSSSTSVYDDGIYSYAECVLTDFDRNHPRQDIIRKLRTLLLEDMSNDPEYIRQLMINDVDRVISLLQNRYQRVIIEHGRIRRERVGASSGSARFV